MQDQARITTIPIKKCSSCGVKKCSSTVQEKTAETLEQIIREQKRNRLAG